MENRLETFSRKEILFHNKPNDCWVIVFNDVYDLTPFIKKHPGGSRILLTRAGDDATSYFQTKHLGDRRIKKYLERFKVGTLPIEERIEEAALEEDFLNELVAVCHKERLYSIDKKRKLKYDSFRIVSFIAFFACILFAFILADVWYLALIMVMFQGIIATSLFGLVAHESIHRNFPKNRVIGYMLNVIWPIVWPFIPQKPLEFEHNNHHIKIGDPEYDFEVAGFAPYIRYSGTVELNNNHKRQHFLAKYLYPFYANIITTIGAAKSTYWSSHNRKMNLEHTLSIVWTFVFYLGLPLLFGKSVLWSFLLYMIFQSTLFIGIYIGSAINHFVPSVINQIPEEHQNKYGYYACHNTTNFCADNTFWFLYTGGFNVQIEHHLIPFIPVENLRKMIPIVKSLCAKYNYPYHNYSKVSQLWNAHYNYLGIMSGNDLSITNEVLNKQQYQAR